MTMKLKAFSAVLLLALSGHASAVTSWTVATSAAANGSAIGSDVASGTTVKLTGYADTGGTGTTGALEVQTLLSYPGIGMKNVDMCGTAANCDASESVQPEHATDNNGRYEMILLSFTGAKVNLTSAMFSYVGSDSDYTVMAYTPATGSPAVTNATSWGSLLGSGWAVVGNYSSDNNTGTAKNFANTTYSSYWLIGAYNPLGSSINLYGNDDAFKLSSVTGCLQGATGSAATGCGSQSRVPEPGSLALVGLGLLGVIRMRKARKA